MLSLGSNCLGVDGITALVSALDANRSLTELFVGDPTTWYVLPTDLARSGATSNQVPLPRLAPTALADITT